MPKLAPPNAHTVDSRDTPYFAYVPPPDIIDDATVVAIVQAVTRTITELAKRKKLKTATKGETP